MTLTSREVALELISEGFDHAYDVTSHPGCYDYRDKDDWPDWDDEYSWSTMAHEVASLAAQFNQLRSGRRGVSPNFSAEEVKAIRLLEGQIPPKTVSDVFGISENMVLSIWAGVSYPNV